MFPIVLTSLRGRTCIVTGASDGIGRETARGLARLEGRVLLVCRDEARGHKAKEDIRRTTRNDNVELFVADFGSQRAIRRAAIDIRARHDRIHVLVNNAGLITRERSVTEDGIETQFAVNHLGPFLLTNLLIGSLRSGAPARIVNVASQVERAGHINFADLHGTRGYNPITAYCQSKLANVLFTYALARRLNGDRITVNCLHPGVIATKLLAGYSGKPWIRTAINRLRYPGPDDGARSSIYLASSPDVEGVTGTFFMDGRPAASSAASRDEDLQARLWEISARLTNLTLL
jgi:NAD(P)-dependent dehydrogenase (short-subunit alcohol dehydrogenase family)